MPGWIEGPSDGVMNDDGSYGIMPGPMSLSERNPYEVHAELVQRIEHLEHAVLLLAEHVSVRGWHYELQEALDLVREAENPGARSNS